MLSHVEQREPIRTTGTRNRNRKRKQRQRDRTRTEEDRTAGEKEAVRRNRILSGCRVTAIVRQSDKAMDKVTADFSEEDRDQVNYVINGWAVPIKN